MLLLHNGLMECAECIGNVLPSLFCKREDHDRLEQTKTARKE